VSRVRGALPAKPSELGRISDRLSFLYVEHARIDRDANAVTVLQEQGVVHVPTAMLAVLLLGPGTRITHAAVSLLAASGCSVVWTGEEGVRLYAGSVMTATSSSLLLRQAALASSQQSRLGVARAMYQMRFPGEDVSRLPLEKLRGREGARVRACYREHAKRTGLPWLRRQYIPGKWRAADPVNQALSAANSALYGVCHAAVLHLGCSAGIGFVHAGHQMSFVYDIADLYKAQVTIPAAFDTAAAHQADLGTHARRAVRDRIRETRLLEQAVADIRSLLGTDGEDYAPRPTGDLWDDAGTVPGGVSYADGAP
jgi:CRISP-associated protein Cas1